MSNHSEGELGSCSVDFDLSSLNLDFFVSWRESHACQVLSLRFRSPSSCRTRVTEQQVAVRQAEARARRQNRRTAKALRVHRLARPPQAVVALGER
jgi:hypothetical protein